MTSEPGVDVCNACKGIAVVVTEVEARVAASGDVVAVTELVLLLVGRCADLLIDEQMVAKDPADPQIQRPDKSSRRSSVKTSDFPAQTPPDGANVRPLLARSVLGLYILC